MKHLDAADVEHVCHHTAVPRLGLERLQDLSNHRWSRVTGLPHIILPGRQYDSFEIIERNKNQNNESTTNCMIVVEG